MADLSFSRTYVTDAVLTDTVKLLLVAFAEAFSKAVRGTYAQDERDARAGVTRTAREKKEWVAHKYQLTSRQAHAVIVEASAKRDSILELDKLQLDELEDRLRKQRGVVARGKASLAEHRKGKTRHIAKPKRLKIKRAIFVAQTKIAKLQPTIKALSKRIKAGITHLTFGTKKLARQRGALDQERLAAVAANDKALIRDVDQRIARWKAEWSVGRDSQIFLVGSKDETSGNQSCTVTQEADKSLTLRVKLPPSMGGERVAVKGLNFAYGHNHLVQALAQQNLRAASKKALTAKALEHQAHFIGPLQPAPEPQLDADGNVVKPKKATLFSQTEVQGGSAISWRFMFQDDGTLKVAFTTDIAPATVLTDIRFGAIGVDLNAGFLSVTETNGHGDFVHSCNYQTPEIGKSANQREAIRGNVVRDIIARCVATGKPLVLEELDFTKKKRDLSMRNPSSKRKLSALAYKAIYDLFCARARDAGVQVITVNPAYTSTQGLVRYAALRGWTVHQAAAGVIARRGQGFSEAAPISGTIKVPVGGTAVEWEIPEEISRSDVSCRWSLLHRGLKQAIASHYRARRRSGQPKAGSDDGCSGIPGCDSPAEAQATERATD